MFVGCSEISVNFIVKHKQHVGIIWPSWGDLFIFSVLGGREKNAGLWFAWGDQHPGEHYVYYSHIKLKS